MIVIYSDFIILQSINGKASILVAIYQSSWFWLRTGGAYDLGEFGWGKLEVFLWQPWGFVRHQTP